VLDSVDEHHVGIASGVNNGVSRVAGLLAIAVLGAVISAHFGSKLDEELGAVPLSGPVAASIAEAKEKPLAVPETGGLPPPQAERIEAAAADASTSSFHLGILIGGILMIAGGIVAGLGIENPRRRVEAVPTRGAAAAGECGHGADADCFEGEPVPLEREAPEPEPA
jgi:hypothetical protein